MFNLKKKLKSFKKIKKTVYLNLKTNKLNCKSVHRWL